MKKILLVLLTAALFSFDRQHTEDVMIFKSHFLPESTYTQTIEQTSMSVVKYSGSKDVLQALKDKGVENPTTTTERSLTDAVIKTGKLNADDRFPLTMEYVKITNSNGKKAIPDGTIIYGYATPTTLPKFDSIVAPGMDEKMKSTILKSMESAFSQLSFPDRKVKVGETFSINTPLSIPVAGINFEMDITTKYKLLSIKNGIADFDVVQVYTMKMNYSKYEIKGKGSGKGKLLYDIKDGYNKKYQVDIDMSLGMKIEGVVIAMIMKSGMIQTIELSPNKM